MSGETPTVFDPATCVRKGLCPVSRIRNKGDPFESHSLYYEQHGSGPEKILFIMGLNSSSFSWEGQVEHFARSKQYSVLVFDNRGVGNSSSPRGPYTTSGMAEDTIALLSFIGWTKDRDLHVVGLSLGGMIAQELASRIPERILSLTLGVTTPGGRPWNNFPPAMARGSFIDKVYETNFMLEAMSDKARLTFTKEVDVKVSIILELVFTKSWLDTQVQGGVTNRDTEASRYRRRIEITRPQTLVGSLSQMCAGLTHYVSPSRLRQISASIPKVLLVTGDNDHLVRPENTYKLKECMPEAELVQWSSCGHALHFQYPDKFNSLLERTFKEGKERMYRKDI